MSRFLLGGVLGALLSGILAWALAQTTTPSPIPAPGAEKSTWTKILGIGADMLQDTTPAKQLDLYVNGFHFVHGHPDRQEEAHHYCQQMTEEFLQCAIYDANEKDAKLIGVEHIISDRLFQELPEGERRMWHPHNYEVKAGLLIAPGIPQAVEHKLMEKLVGTWGKTWHVWHPKQDALPMGQAALMMGFTADGQIKPALVEARDRRFDVATNDLRRQRADIPDPGSAAALQPRAR